MIFLFFGVFILIINSLFDLLRVVKQSFAEEKSLSLKHDSDNTEFLTQCRYKVIEKVTKELKIELRNLSTQYNSTHKVVSKLRDNMQVVNCFIKLLYGSADQTDKSSIKDYNLMKELLINSSVKVGLQLRFYPFMVNTVIEEIKMCNSIRKIKSK